MSRLNMDDFLESLGNPGRFQIVSIAVLCWTYAYVVSIHFSIPFLTEIPEHTCKLPGNWTFARNLSIPNQEIGAGVVQYDECNMYIDPENHSIGIKPCDEFDFELTSPDQLTVATEWDFACRKTTHLSVFEASYFVGVICGCLLAGFFGDKYGRLNAFIFSIVVEVITVCAIYFSHNYMTVILLLFARGIFLQILQISATVLCMEIVLGEIREKSWVLMSASSTFGVLLATALANSIVHWRHYMLTLASASVVPLLATWLLPESPRLLLARRRLARMLNLVARISKFNRLPVSKDINDRIKNLSEELCQKKNGNQGQTIIDVIKAENYRSHFWKLQLYVIGVHIGVWIPLHMFNNLGGDTFVNRYIIIMVDFISRLLAYYPLVRFGRKFSLIVSSLFIGIMSIMCASFSAFSEGSGSVLSILAATSAVLIVVGTGIFWTAFITYVCELFPTTVRSGCLGLILASCYFCALLDDKLLSLGSVWKQLPLVVCGITALGAAVIPFFMPDTKYEPLQDIIPYVKAANGITTKSESAKKGECVPLRIIPREPDANN